MKEEKPLVSVAMITYGHESYIVEALQGIFKQIYDGNIEFIVSDDKSPDKTEEIVKQYLANNEIPSNIKFTYIRQDPNKGMLTNFIWTINQCVGKYIAICEGDDFWTDPLKIQKQVDFMEQHAEYAILFSNADMLVERSQNDTGGKFRGISEGRAYSGAEILINWIAHTSTYFFRNGDYMKELSVFFGKYKFLYGDTPLFLYLVEQGKAYGMTDFMSTYRRHESGITSEKENFESGLRYIAHLKEINRAFAHKEYVAVNDHLIAVTYYNLFRNGSLSYWERIKYIGKSFNYEPTLFFKIIKEKIA